MKTKITEINLFKKEQLENSPLKNKFFIEINTFNFNKNINSFIYKIEIGFLTENFCLSHFILKRYSEIKKLDLILKKNILNFNLKFPSKKYFFKNDLEFIKNRVKDLNNYFKELTLIPEILSIPEFQFFFEISICE